MSAYQAQQGGPALPTSETARVQAGRIEEQKSRQEHFRASGTAHQAALSIESEAYATAYVARLRADAVQPGELAVLLSFLAGEMLHGACRVIEKALRGGRHE